MSKIILRIIFITFVLVSCTQKNSDEKSGYTKPEPSEDETRGGDSKTCLTSEVLNILDDKKTIVSRAAQSDNQYIVWNHNSL